MSIRHVAGNTDAFLAWTNGRSLSSLGTNDGAAPIAIQSWRPVKESFAPEIVLKLARSADSWPGSVVDPFGGSGTTALAAQFLGIEPTTMEVNPYLADVIRAKLANYDADEVENDFARLSQTDPTTEFDLTRPVAPITFYPPGKKARYLFHDTVIDRIVWWLRAIDTIDSEPHRRLARILLSSLFVSVSNARVSGKGRRYRATWESRIIANDKIDAAFTTKLNDAAHQIRQYGNRSCQSHTVVEGDVRAGAFGDRTYAAALTSPPYPNSFDYTDVYNIELWLLGYLATPADNTRLRARTLASHVQVARSFSAPPSGSDCLEQTLEALRERSEELWDHKIPDMIGGYFADLIDVSRKVADALEPGSPYWLVVGDSQYAGVRIDVAKVLAELAPAIGLQYVETEVLRSMRSAPQQGGTQVLPESIVKFKRAL